MSKRELERSAILSRVKSGTLKLTEAAMLLRLSYRQAKRIYARYREKGAKGLVHRGVGKTSNRSHPAAEREMVLSLVREHYGGNTGKGHGQRFGPTLTAEHLFTDHGVLIPVRTLATWMIEGGLWSRTRRVKTIRFRRRERKAHFGELVQLDGSFHYWLEERGSKGCLMTMVDDATGRTLLSMGKEETTWSAANLLKNWISLYGVPRCLYTDWKNVYLKAPTSTEVKSGELPLTQFGRMCEKLGIELIGASSPQAKGRVERAHGTHQDRLVKKLRLKEITDYAGVNAYLSEYITDHNARFSVSPASAVDYHLPRSVKRIADDDVFCLETARVVSNDFVVQYCGRPLQLEPSGRGRVPAGSKVLVRETEDGRLSVVQITGQGRDRRERKLKWSDAPARRSQRASVGEAPTKLDRKTRGLRPSVNHPWRMSSYQWDQQLVRLRRTAPMCTQENDNEQAVFNQQP